MESQAPIRALTAVALCDGHDAAIVAVSRALRLHGVEVVYIGFHKSPAEVAHAAVQEDVDVIGLSSYNGGHVEYVADLAAHLRRAGASPAIVCGGGGTITPEDVAELKALGVARVFLPGETLDDMARVVRRIARDRVPAEDPPDLAARALEGEPLALGRVMTLIERGAAAAELLPADATDRQVRVVAVAGPGGAGKSTLIDELVLRWLKATDQPVAVLCSDPSGAIDRESGEAGALLGDRIRMLSAGDPRVFARSLATRTSSALSPAVREMAAFLRKGPFPLVIVETAGIGQADQPFADAFDLSVLVMTDEFGSPIQLEKLAALEAADVVVLNKSDRPAAPAAQSMIRSRLRSVRREGRPPVEFLATAASRHRDPGVDRLYALLAERLRVGAEQEIC
ncbi:MAG: cobalamin-dependent protein [Candidatus Sumerlaeia bacterium]|nr:cobalamin-dependent protein [Candidatus Sumerlaeia bacterium]